MLRMYRNFKGVAARAGVGALMAALMAAMVIGGAVQLASAQAAPEKAPEKKVKDQGEYDIYNQVLKDTDPVKQIQDLDTWAQKYPESDYKNDDRPYLYLQAY